MPKRVQLLVYTGLLLTAACSSRPDAELLDARSALEAASTAEADLYCPEVYQQAADCLSAGELELANQDQARTGRKDFRRTIELLTRARREAENAAVIAGTRRERAKSIAICRQSVAEMDLEQARKRVASVRRSADQLHDDWLMANRLIKEARKAYSEGRFMDAAHQFEAVALQSRTIDAKPAKRRQRSDQARASRSAVPYLERR